MRMLENQRRGDSYSQCCRRSGTRGRCLPIEVVSQRAHGGMCRVTILLNHAYQAREPSRQTFRLCRCLMSLWPDPPSRTIFEDSHSLSLAQSLETRRRLSILEMLVWRHQYGFLPIYTLVVTYLFSAQRAPRLFPGVGGVRITRSDICEASD